MVPAFSSLACPPDDDFDSNCCGYQIFRKPCMEGSFAEFRQNPIPNYADFGDYGGVSLFAAVYRKMAAKKPPKTKRGARPCGKMTA
jgi:hypothetical protein